MTNGEIREQMNEIYNVWWRKYCKIDEITEKVLDDAYTTGKEIVDRLQSKLVFDVWFNLMRELESRWKRGVAK